ncbi:hypothetical protein CYMTET_20699 [Cymbomonas tetramitiformis]|uniref:Uncharacterized protein n=1 Tax=Cymbomonas tetramitiformis TaxID=36881 RepID=A0AAE0G400_9CHLO|nr:hypothetical protein CYMTET_20699 [Cymbomonas tetramitiformis]
MMNTLLAALLLFCHLVEPARELLQQRTPTHSIRHARHSLKGRGPLTSSKKHTFSSPHELKSKAKRNVGDERLPFYKRFMVPQYNWTDSAAESSNAEPMVWHIGRELTRQEKCFMLSRSSKCLPQECSRVEHLNRTHRLLITGMGRSGTLFSSTALTQLGLNVRLLIPTS